MIELKSKEDCCGCYACYNKCPKKAIEMIEDEKGFKYPKVNKHKCINCGLCDKVCPIINKTNIQRKINAYACINKNDKIRKQSSSGGIFTILAEEILNKQGVVFGASFDEEFNVVHNYVEKLEDLEKLRGSKYVQSLINDTYKKAKEFLESDRYVLYTGTPCQIEGLKKYLDKEYEKLYTQDIICHGVPSPKIWRKYLMYREKKDGNKPHTISFRNKDDGWKLFNMKFQYLQSVYKKNHNEDLYMKIFLSNVALRDSCYNCHFKKKDRVSDITLADFWGIENILPSINDNKGTSLVIINSEKGNKLFENVKNDIIYEEVNIEKAIQYNKNMINSVPLNPNRENFFIDIERQKFKKVVNRYVPNTKIIKKILRKIKNIKKLKFINKI